MKDVLPLGAGIQDIFIETFFVPSQESRGGSGVTESLEDRDCHGKNPRETSVRKRRKKKLYHKRK